MSNKILSDKEFEALEEKEITFFSEKEGEVKMTVKQAVRWGLLKDALDHIAQEFEDRNLDFDELLFTDKVRPTKAVVKYIDECYIAAVNDFNIESHLIS